MDVLVLNIQKMAMFELVTYFEGQYLLKALTEFCNHFFPNATNHKVHV